MAAEVSTLKHEAMATLDASRQEISAEMHRLRHDLSPKHVTERIVHDHSTGIFVAALSTGLVLTWLLIRHAHANSQPEVSAIAAPLAHAAAPVKHRHGRGKKRLLGWMLKSAAVLAMKSGLQILHQRMTSPVRPQPDAEASVPEIMHSRGFNPVSGHVEDEVVLVG